MNKKILALVCLIVIAFGLERLYYRQNGGFRISKIISPVPPAPTSPLENLTHVNTLLDQPFHFLGSGGTSFVFLGEDKKTVLKLFKHQHLIAKNKYLSFSLPAALDAWRIRQILQKEKKHEHKRQAFFFNSCDLAYRLLKEETGLIYLSLQPSTSFAKQVKLIDAWGISHSFDLSQTEFALQKNADLLFPALEKLLADKTRAESAIDSLIALIRSRCEKGIGDRDPNLLINFGLIEGKAVEFDLGSYYVNEELKSPFAIARELFLSTHSLRLWLQKYAPDLLEYLLRQIELVAVTIDP